MIPSHLATLFWDADLENLTPEAYPDYIILRVLEYGDRDAMEWLKGIFPETEIRRVLTTEARLSRKSATF